MREKCVLTKKDIGNYIKVYDKHKCEGYNDDNKYVRITKKMIKFFENVDINPTWDSIVIKDKQTYSKYYNFDFESYFKQNVPEREKDIVHYIPNKKEIIPDSEIIEIWKRYQANKY